MTTPTARPLTEAEIEALEERAEAATPGPWEARDVNYGRDEVFIQTTGRPIRGVARVWWPDEDIAGDDRANAAFIAAARTDVPALVAEVRRQAAGIERLRAIEAAVNARAAKAEKERDEERAEMLRCTGPLVLDRRKQIARADAAEAALAEAEARWMNTSIGALTASRDSALAALASMREAVIGYLRTRPLHDGDCMCAGCVLALAEGEPVASLASAFVASLRASVRREARREVAEAWLRGPALGDETSGTYAWLRSLADEKGGE